MEGLEAAPGELEEALQRDTSRLRARLRHWVEAPLIRESLFIASPALVESLHYWLEDADSEQGRKVERTLVRYFARMAGRAGAHWRHLLTRLAACWREKSWELVLTEDDLRALESRDTPPLPEPFSIVATVVVGASTEHVDNGAYRLVLESLSGPSGAVMLGILARRGAQMRPFAEKLRAAEREGRLTLPVAGLAESFLHMHPNRMLASDQRAQELILSALSLAAGEDPHGRRMRPTRRAVVNSLRSVRKPSPTPSPRYGRGGFPSSLGSGGAPPPKCLRMWSPKKVMVVATMTSTTDRRMKVVFNILSMEPRCHSRGSGHPPRGDAADGAVRSAPADVRGEWHGA
ncbi:lantibiotic dehydratase [Myxococcus llanfairpwllgwyngyllgogerychwyrndrobwllllantysiliogogogochensis]|uniref:lantibiotic dehydratase n=1 Tax=Myxococcus llanfairpwllgwyngyllgogerychwyrndrobwllllantysiliogogogochensis TaxID=2590453 RepID=UPI0015F01393|nr:lantibiotic dehydratase [Myxococcus llanfairpwllgwyngyllgogerychwyrndrobwllllantysiliogogogochensis]